MDLTHNSFACTDFQCILCLSKPTQFEMDMKIEYLKIQTGVIGHAAIDLGFGLVYDFSNEGIVVYQRHIKSDIMHGLHVTFKPDCTPLKITMYDTGKHKWSIISYA